MTVRGNTLNVTQQTSIDHLRGFLDKAGDDSRIRGEKLADGTVRLYSKPDKTGFMARLQSLGPNARKHREIGRDAIKQIFANQPRKANEALSGHVRAAVDPGFARDMKSGAVKLLSAIAAKTALRMDAEDGAAVQQGRPSPKLAECGLSGEQLATLARAAADTVGQGGDAVAAGAVLGKAVAKAFSDTNPSAEARQNFAFSLGADLMGEMLDLLRPLLTDADTDWPNLPPEERKTLNHLTTSAFNAAASNILDDRMQDNGDLQLGGKTYTQMKQLGQGGFGTVDLYVNTLDPSDRIAVKVPTVKSTGNFSDDQDLIVEGFRSGLTEMDAHRAVEGDGHANIVALRGAVRCPNGGIAIALEFCEGGDLTGMTKAIDTAVTAGTLSPERGMAAKATLAKDYLQGVVHAHDNGMANRDLKPDNMFITGQGTLKVGDQGGARSIAVYNARSNDSQTVQFIAPEVSVTAKKVLEHTKAALFRGDGATVSYTKRDEVRQLIDRQMPGLSGAQKQALLTSYEDAATDDLMARKYDPRNRDLYAVGGSLLALVGGKNIHHGRGAFEISSRLQSAYDNPDLDVVPDIGAGTQADGAWTAANAVIRNFNDLANQLMKADPLKRLSAADALRHPLFADTPGLDGDQARADIRQALNPAGAPISPPIQATQSPPPLTTVGAPPPGSPPLLRTTIGSEDDFDDLLASIARERASSILI